MNPVFFWDRDIGGAYVLDSIEEYNFKKNSVFVIRKH
jgi:hypothetical protein